MTVSRRANRDEGRMAKPTTPESDRSKRSPVDDEVPIALGFRRGDRAATKLVRRRVRRIVSYRRYGMSREDRIDVEQEVMTQLWQATRQHDCRFEGGFWGFVETVAIRRCIDWLRAHREHAALDPSRPAQGDPLSHALVKERDELASAAVERLDDQCRELLRLRVDEHRSYREISRILGASEGALRIRMHRCIEKAGEILRRLQAAETPEDPRPRNRG